MLAVVTLGVDRVDVDVAPWATGGLRAVGRLASPLLTQWTLFEGGHSYYVMARCGL